MQIPSSISLLPVITFGRVVGYVPDQYAIYVTLQSGQTLGQPVRLLVNGPADAWRINQQPLPIKGTWGLIAFPHGDIRGAIWLGSFFCSTMDAITGSDPPIELDSQTKYESFFAGGYSFLDGNGNYFYRCADGSTLAINANGTEPNTYRHFPEPINNTDVLELNAVPPPPAYKREQLPVQPSDRNPNPQHPFILKFQHPLGDVIQVNDEQQTGTISIIGPSSGVVHADFPLNYHSQITMDDLGSIKIYAANIAHNPSPEVDIFAGYPGGRVLLRSSGGALFLGNDQEQTHLQGPWPAVNTVDCNTDGSVDMTTHLLPDFGQPPSSVSIGPALVGGLPIVKLLNVTSLVITLPAPQVFGLGFSIYGPSPTAGFPPGGSPPTINFDNQGNINITTSVRNDGTPTHVYANGHQVDP